MPHVAIYGQTESGKSTLAKALAAHYKSRNVGVIVLDPLGDPAWNADFQTDNPEEFLDVVWRSKRCAIFIDEAGENVGRYDLAMVKTATRGRHWGHNCHYITQRGAMLSQTVRDQCSELFLFTTSVADNKIHANEWNKEELRTANALPQGHYFHCTRFGPISKLALW